MNNEQIASINQQVEALAEVQAVRAGEPPSSRMSYPMDAMQIGSNLAEEIGKKIGLLEQRLGDVLLEPPLGIAKDDAVSEHPDARSPIIEKSREMHRLLAACIAHLDRLIGRLDL